MRLNLQKSQQFRQGVWFLTCLLAMMVISPASVEAEPTETEPESERQFFSRDLEQVGTFPLVASHRANTARRDVSSRVLESRSFGLEQSTVNVLAPPGNAPTDIANVEFKRFDIEQHPMGTSRFPAPIDCHWKSPAFCHRPLYFEQVAMERYGVTNKVIQPLLSATRFYGTVPLLPILCLRDVSPYRPSTLGFERPGSPQN